MTLTVEELSELIQLVRAHFARPHHGDCLQGEEIMALGGLGAIRQQAEQVKALGDRVAALCKLHEASEKRAQQWAEMAVCLQEQMDARKGQP